MARTILTTIAEEGTPYRVRISFADVDGTAVTPTTATYTVTDRDGNVVHSLSGIVASGLATSVDIILTATDMLVDASAASGQVRILTIEYTYDGTVGSGVTDRQEVWFALQDLVVVT